MVNLVCPSSSPPLLSTSSLQCCYTAAGASGTYKAAAMFVAASPTRHSSPLSSLPFPPLHLCYEAAGAERIYMAAASIGAASPGCLASSPHFLLPSPSSLPAQTLLSVPCCAGAEYGPGDEATGGGGGTKHGYGWGGSHDWGGLHTISSSPVGRTGCGANYGAAATRLLHHITHTNDRLGSEDLNVTVTTKPASNIRSPRDIAFRLDGKHSSSTYFMCRCHYRHSRFLQLPSLNVWDNYG